MLVHNHYADMYARQICAGFRKILSGPSASNRKYRVACSEYHSEHAGSLARRVRPSIRLRVAL